MTIRYIPSGRGQWGAILLRMSLTFNLLNAIDIDISGWDVVEYDDSNGAIVNANTTVYMPPWANYWKATAYGTFAFNATGGRRMAIHEQSTGRRIVTSQNSAPPTSIGGLVVCQSPWIQRSAVPDGPFVRAFQNSGGTIGLTAGIHATKFWVEFR